MGALKYKEERGPERRASKRALRASISELEQQLKKRKVVPAKHVFNEICVCSDISGHVSIMFHDAVNKHNEQRHLGPVESTNLCTEIVQKSTPEEPAVCILAGINLSKFVEPGKPYDFVELHRVVKLAVWNLNRIIDQSSCGTKEATRSMKKHRALGVGRSGFAESLLMMGLNYESVEAKRLNVDVAETMAHAAYEASCEWAEKNGPHGSFEGSPLSEGVFHHETYLDANDERTAIPSDRWDWETLRERIRKRGVANALHLAQMPAATTGNLMGITPGCEPMQVCTVKEVKSGSYVVWNPRFLEDLETMRVDGRLNQQQLEILMKRMRHTGSRLVNVNFMPSEAVDKYKSAWEVPLEVCLGEFGLRAASLTDLRFLDSSRLLGRRGTLF